MALPLNIPGKISLSLNERIQRNWDFGGYLIAKRWEKNQPPPLEKRPVHFVNFGHSQLGLLYKKQHLSELGYPDGSPRLRFPSQFYSAPS